MTYRVTILRRAWQDIVAIEAYISARSKQGAKGWVKSFDKALASLKRDPSREPLAPESEGVPEEIRHILFRTRSGRTYRAVFLIVADEVRILRIRGAGQDNVSPDDMGI